MKNLAGYKEEIHSCSKCGLCQSVCPIYKLTGNDCTVSRGLFIMLKNLIRGKISMSKNINRYLDLCLKCGKCSNFCPSEIDAVEIITTAKNEYFESSKLEKILSILQRYIIFGLGVKFLGLFSKNCKSKHFERKVIYFGGCGSKVSGNSDVIKLLNDCGIEVLTPNFECCGIPFLVRGDFNTYEKYKQSFIDKIKRYGVNEVVTTCSSCEKTLKRYNIDGLVVKNIYEYLREKDLKLKLKKTYKVTYHKPCYLENYKDVEWLLSNTENLEYIKMEGYDECCGLNGLFKFKDYGIMSKIYKNKRNNIINTGVKDVLTSCVGCEVALKIFSFGKYRVMDTITYLAKNSATRD